jgi:hypothetical protein
VIRNLWFAALTGLAVLTGAAVAAKAQAAAKVLPLGERYAVYSRPSPSSKWLFRGTYDPAAAQRVSQQLRGQGLSVLVRRLSAGPARPHVAPLNTARFPQERAKVNPNNVFPHLGNDYEVLRPADLHYNCIAWSLGITDRWVWPGKTVADFDRLYGSHGYRRIGTLDYRAQPGAQKIVLYGKISYVNGRQVIECTHGARQLADGTWTSKLGRLPAIRHRTPNALNGYGPNGYGQPVAVYVRTTALAGR